jgi:hypothetical protein
VIKGNTSMINYTWKLAAAFGLAAAVLGFGFTPVGSQSDRVPVAGGILTGLLGALLGAVIGGVQDLLKASNRDQFTSPEPLPRPDANETRFKA